MIDLPVFRDAYASLRRRPDDDPIVLAGPLLGHVAVSNVGRNLVRVTLERITVPPAAGAPRDRDVAR
jgi:hypothetical protein